ncbi:S1 family peptidase [Argonema antarcticum]|uniref:S1 family peptidase n=1 Tax=Argonema antarcticum TaxID=2942763 RepID=UPI0020125DE1|nr:serine protease [Argonema antarcticum]MCL1472207.1 serine protease [Argonema antarcticum A004/B2]
MAFAMVAIFTLITKAEPNNSSYVESETQPLIISQNISVEDIAQEVTVRIIGNPGVASGVIVARQGQTYTVLTCDHVVARSENNRFTILTPDGLMHAASWRRFARFRDADLALVEFRSDRPYQLVEIGDSNALTVGASVYASGFPNWYRNNRRQFQNTRNWGLRAYRLTTGRVGMMLERSLQRGYQLGYTNNIEMGMSGGPVLNRYGQLVGINGRSKYPLLGIQAFKFEDGTVPSQRLFRQMEALSWAIPVATFEQMNK